MLYQDNNILIFDFDFDRTRLNEEFLSLKDKFLPYEDPRGKLDWWQVARDIESPYGNELCDFFDIIAKPRFYILKANTTLPFHKDFGTECSINILINHKNPAPVKFRDNDYSYEQCLLNVQNEHGVDATDEDRILYKLSIFDESYDSVANKIIKKIK